MSEAVETRPAGWRPDPSGRYEWRYWDGGWTNRVANSSPSARPASEAPRALNPGASPSSGPPRRPEPGPQRLASSAPSPAGSSTAPPPSDSELAVMAAVQSGRRSTPPARALPAETPRRRRLFKAPTTGVLAAIAHWFQGMSDEE